MPILNFLVIISGSESEDEEPLSCHEFQKQCLKKNSSWVRLNSVFTQHLSHQHIKDL
ncbi:hypothetical protein HanPSC8_Chr17g0789201 [Helianthus annuus]|nr:hypothetical protein HanPSC8_Chr17g0789201 [Helianthus annuus]